VGKHLTIYQRQADGVWEEDATFGTVTTHRNQRDRHRIQAPTEWARGPTEDGDKRAAA